jgi:hypothetical protein
MRIGLKCVGVCAIVLSLALPTGVAAQGSGLEFVSPESVALTISGGTSEDTSIWLKNATDEQVIPNFKTVLEDSDGEAVAAEVKADEKPLAANDVALYRFHVEGGAVSSGQLVATAPSMEPATVPLTMGEKSVADPGLDGVLIFPLIAAVLLIFAAWFFFVRPIGLLEPLGALELKFGESFASTLTAAGALLGTIIAASVLPEETVNLSRAGFTGLNLIFGVAIVVAGVVYAAAQLPVWKDVPNEANKQESKFQGYVLPFLLAALITVWAAFGELLTLWLLIAELGQDQGFSSFAIFVIRALIVLAAAGMIPYTLFRVKGIAKSKRDKPGGAAAYAPATPAPSRNVTLL